MSWAPRRPSWLSWSGPPIPLSRAASMAASIWTLGAILRSTAWSPLRTSKVRFGAYAVFTFTAVSGRHLGGLSPDRRHDMAVCVEGEADLRVPECLHDDARRHALGEQERGARMAQVV